MISQKRSKQMENELFKKFMNENETLQNFLIVGLVSSEILEFFESLHGKIINRKAIKYLLYRGLPKISHVNPDSIAIKMAGYMFSLKKNGRGSRGKTFTVKKSYSGGLVYYTSPGSDLSRVYYEIIDSKKLSFPVRLLSVINELENVQPPTMEEIKSHMGLRTYDQLNRWLPKLIKKVLIKQKNGNNKNYYLPLRTKIIFHRDISGTWEDIKNCPYRKIFYSR